jgi:hypothetical protein
MNMGRRNIGTAALLAALPFLGMVTALIRAPSSSVLLRQSYLLYSVSLGSSHPLFSTLTTSSTVEELGFGFLQEQEGFLWGMKETRSSMRRNEMLTGRNSWRNEGRGLQPRANT